MSAGGWFDIDMPEENVVIVRSPELTRLIDEGRLRRAEHPGLVTPEQAAEEHARQIAHLSRQLHAARRKIANQRTEIKNLSKIVPISHSEADPCGGLLDEWWLVRKRWHAPLNHRSRPWIGSHPEAAANIELQEGGLLDRELASLFLESRGGLQAVATGEGENRERGLLAGTECPLSFKTRPEALGRGRFTQAGHGARFGSQV